MLTSRGLGRVLGDLASMGFDARWGVLGAADVGANHQRDRIWIIGKVTIKIHKRSAQKK
jgi:DNA (cytosine-5)-methyltransferase 1